MTTTREIVNGDTKGLEIEFKIDDWIDDGHNQEPITFTVLSGGRAQISDTTWAHAEPFFWAMHASWFINILETTTFPLEKEIPIDHIRSRYQSFRLNLIRIKNIALALLEKDCGVHELRVLEYYMTLKSQSDRLLAISTTHHPELEEYRLPEINNTSIEAIREMVKRALNTALLQIKTAFN